VASAQIPRSVEWILETEVPGLQGLARY